MSDNQSDNSGAWGQARAAIAQQPEAWGVETEDGAMLMVFLDRAEAATYCDGAEPVALGRIGGAAIAQPAEPVQQRGTTWGKVHDALHATQADAQPVAPVVWVNRATLASAKVAQDRGGPFDQHTWSECQTDFHDTPIAAAAPPARQPLTEAQIQELCCTVDASGARPAATALIRAVERHYGIGEGEKP